MPDTQTDQSAEVSQPCVDQPELFAGQPEASAEPLQTVPAEGCAPPPAYAKQPPPPPLPFNLAPVPNWDKLPAEMPTAVVAAVLHMSEGNVRALVSDRKRKAQKGLELTDAAGLPEPVPSGNQRLHDKENIRRFWEAREAQKLRSLPNAIGVGAVPAEGAELIVRPPAGMIPAKNYEEITADLRGKDDIIQHKDAIIEAKDARIEELQNKVVSLLEAAQRVGEAKRRWWDWRA